MPVSPCGKLGACVKGEREGRCEDRRLLRHRGAGTRYIYKERMKDSGWRRTIHESRVDTERGLTNRGSINADQSEKKGGEQPCGGREESRRSTFSVGRKRSRG